MGRVEKDCEGIEKKRSPQHVRNFHEKGRTHQHMHT